MGFAGAWRTGLVAAFLIAAILSVLSLSEVRAADFAVITPDVISVKGLIEADDCQHWQAALRPGVKYVLLNSNGGLNGQGECISRSIFKLRLKTIVVEKCVSICFLLFAAGAERSVCGSGAVGVHRPVDVKTKQEDPDPQFLNVIIDYARRYGTPEVVIGHLTTTPGTQMYYLSADELRLMAKNCV